MIGTRPLRILVVDDDPAMVGAITALVGTEGHQVITAYDGLTAVKRYREERPDLVLLDLAMPGPDGFTVIGQLRATGNVPVLVVSGESAEAAKVKALGIGADDYLVKPFGKQELLARISAVMRRVDLAGTGRIGGNGDGPAGVLTGGLADAGAGPPRGARRGDRAGPDADRVPAARGARARRRRPRRAPPARPRGLAGRARSRPAVAQAAPRPPALEAGGRRWAADRRRALGRLPDRGRRAGLTRARRSIRAPNRADWPKRLAGPGATLRAGSSAVGRLSRRTASSVRMKRRGPARVSIRSRFAVLLALLLVLGLAAPASAAAPSARVAADAAAYDGRLIVVWKRRRAPDPRMSRASPSTETTSRPCARSSTAQPGRTALVAAALRADPRVLAVVPDARLSLLDWPADGSPSDPLFDEQRDLAQIGVPGGLADDHRRPVRRRRGHRLRRRPGPPRPRRRLGRRAAQRRLEQRATSPTRSATARTSPARSSPRPTTASASRASRRTRG